MRMMFAVLLLLTGCATTIGRVDPAQDVLPQGNVHTLGYTPGKTPYAMSDVNFAAGAKQVCGGETYKILEKSAAPATLRRTESLIPTGSYFWVIRCEQVAH